MHCNSCVFYRVLWMMSHSRRTHLDIFCKLYFAPGFLQKYQAVQHILLQYSRSRNHLNRVGLRRFLGFYCYYYVAGNFRHFHFSLHQTEQNFYSEPLRHSFLLVIQTQMCSVVTYKAQNGREKKRRVGCSISPAYAEAVRKILLSAIFSTQLPLENHEDNCCVTSVISFFEISTHGMSHH